jgi:uncharacterized protein YaaR (DUF327 family)
MERDNNEGVESDGHFNLCEAAAEKGYWDIVKLAWDHGCPCSVNIKLQFTEHQLQHQSTKHRRQLLDMQSKIESIQKDLESSQQLEQHMRYNIDKMIDILLDMDICTQEDLYIQPQQSRQWFKKGPFAKSDLGDLKCHVLSMAKQLNLLKVK